METLVTLPAREEPWDQRATSAILLFAIGTMALYPDGQEAASFVGLRSRVRRSQPDEVVWQIHTFRAYHGTSTIVIIRAGRNDDDDDTYFTKVVHVLYPDT